MKKRKSSIQKKLVASFASGSLLIVAVFLALSFWLSTTSAERNTGQELKQYTEQVATTLDNQFAVYKDILKVSSSSSFFTDYYSTKLVSSINAHLKSYIQTFQNIKYFYFGTKTEDMYIFPYVQMKEGYNPRQTEWYRLAEQNGEASISSIYLDSITKQPIITVSQPVYNIKQELVGVLGVDVKLEDLLKTIKESTTSVYSRIILLDNRNEPIEIEKDPLTREILAKEEIQNLLKSENTIAKLKINNENYFATAKKLEESNYKIIVFTGSDRIMQSSIKINSIVAIAGLILLLLSTILFVVISKKLIRKPIDNLKSAFSFDSNGQVKLTRVDCKTNDEMEELSNTLNMFSDQVRELVQKSTKVSKELLELSIELDENISNSTITEEEIVESIGNLAEISQNQAEHAEQGMSSVANFGESLESSIRSVNALIEENKKLAKDLEDSTKTFKEFSDLSEKSSTAAKEIGEMIDDTEIKSRAIGDVNEIIKKISSQTNLLSLNASIEAARAGEAGKGFAVVADEVRKLAEESEKSATEINDMTNTLIKTAESAVEKMQVVGVIVQNQTQKADEAYQTYLKMIESAGIIEKDIEKITKLLDVLNKSKENVFSSFENIAGLTQETAANSQEVSASSQEQGERMRILAEKSKYLNQVAKDLKEGLDKFMM